MPQVPLVSSVGAASAVELLRAAVHMPPCPARACSRRRGARPEREPPGRGARLCAQVFAKAAFDIDAVDVAAAAPRCLAPALFAHARSDLLVHSAHSHRVWEQARPRPDPRALRTHTLPGPLTGQRRPLRAALRTRNLCAALSTARPPTRGQYGGDKHLVLFDGDHNSARPDHFRRRARDFLVDCFLVPLPPLPHVPRTTPHTSKECHLFRILQSPLIDSSCLNVTYLDFCKAPS